MAVDRENPGARNSDVFAGGGETAELMRATDWTASPLGAPETWPQSLRTAVGIVLESRFPMYIAWGPELVQLYNDPYRPVLGSTKHPAAMGQSARLTFAESWHIIGPMFEGVRQGTGVGADDWMLPLDRHGYLEECYFTFSYSPIRDESGRVGGILVTVTETTGRVLGERRLRTLRDLAASAGQIQREEDAWRGAAAALEAAALDVPFALIYRIERRAGEPAAPPQLAAWAGWEPAAPPADQPPPGAGPAEAWPFAAAAADRRPQLVAGAADRLAELPRGPWPEPPHTALVIAVARPGADQPYGFLVAGLSSRRAPDDDYRAFIGLIADHIATAVGNARAYEEEKQRADALAEIDRTKTSFFSNVSHELRTPLTLMLGPIEESLADTAAPLPPSQRARHEVVRRNGLRMQKLVNTLLDFARIEAGRAQALLVPTDLAALTTDLASSFHSAMEGVGLALVVDCPPLPEPIHVDAPSWEKIVLNLLSNALKFTFAGTVRVALAWRGARVELTVTDSGIGIPAHELPRIFDRFHRVEGARGRSHEGSGIGLSLVKELVALHGGTVEVASAPGEGTAFTVSVPTGTAHVPAHRLGADPGAPAPNPIAARAFLAEASQWRADEPVTVAAADPRAERLLVVDDNPDMRGYLARILSPRWTVEAVSDGARALASAGRARPDLILSDVMMPGLDGLGLVRALRADERTRTIPVLLLSARAGEEAAIEGFQSGADGYLVKPFSADELLARVAAQLTVSRLRQDAIRVEREHAERAGLLLAEAERATRSREEILAVVSHDLRSPLAAIGTATELIERALGDDDRDRRLRRHAAAIRRSTGRMDRLVHDLLDLASIDAGALSLDRQPHAADQLAAEAADAFAGQAADKGLTLEVAAAAGLPPLPCDRDRLVQALGNLIGNAVKFTPAGGAVRVRADRAPAGDALRFTVEDTGQGISPHVQPHIFDRAWNARQRRADGHGLGLSIVRGIVEGHGGHLELASSLGAGSAFSFTIPLDAAAPPAPAAEPAPAPDRDSFVQGGGAAGALIRAFDWSTTCLGPMAEWPQSLRTSVSTMLRSPYPIILFWGPDLVMLYNDPFTPILGDKHPATVGASAHAALAEAWEILGPLLKQALDTGEPLYVQDGAVYFARLPGGMREESYFTWSYNPTIDEAGEIGGLFAIASETTRQVIGDRRLGTLRELSLRTAYDRDVERAFRSIEGVLAQAGADVPFALLYVMEAGVARLVCCTGVERGGGAAPRSLTRADATPWPLWAVGEDRLVEDIDATLGPLTAGPWPEPVVRALVLAVPIGADADTGAVLVAGLSPRQPLNDSYRSFLQLLARQMSASISSVRAYEEEAERAAKLAELDRAKTDFFSNVSHEFRTPLTLILGPVEDALAGATRALAGHDLELVHRNALRLHKMVNTLLDFSRIEAGRAEAAFVPTDLARATASLIGQFQSAAAHAGLALEVACAPLPEPIYVDPEMWEKIVLNLISNALKYTHHGGIRVGLAWEDQHAVLTVRDTGVGIPADELPRVFERFFRARVTRGRSHEGTGIGLALVRELVKIHGGTIEVTSAPGEGSTFTVRLPRGAAHVPPGHLERADRTQSPATVAAPFVEEARRWVGDAASDAAGDTTADDGAASAAPGAALAGAPELPAALRSSRILLVDDNADLRDYVAGLLRRSFSNVETATHGGEALERARAHPPALVLSDVMMPVMDGIALVRALRADERTRSIPIILLSARAGDESTIEGLASGADDYLIKPFSSRELVARVSGQLEMSRVRAEVWRERARIEELQRSIAARDEFISVASHELRTPLTPLLLQLELLQAHAATDTRLERKLHVVMRQVERLRRLTESLLNVSRLALGRLELAPEELDLAELVRSVIERHAADAQAARGSIELTAAPATGRWDRASLETVVGSLLSNAVKYAPGTRIDVSVHADGDAAHLAVRDAGIGIAAESLPGVFGRFTRAVSAGHYGGLGVGLYLARGLVEAHGGAIHVESAPGRGSTFSVRLPRRPPEHRR